MSFRSRLKLFFLIAGPGIVVMLADTDAGSIITAAQSGASLGYRLLPLQFILIPILFIAQELALRMGIITGKGHGELIKSEFGKGWAWLSVSALMLACLGAMVSEFSGIAGVGLLFGIPKSVSLFITIIFLSVIVLTSSYRRVERVAIFLGLFELVFIWVAIASKPSMTHILQDVHAISLTDPNYLYLSAATIGAVIMPWMIFYQQSAVVDKPLSLMHLKVGRIDTAIGAVITQCIMAAVLITTAAVLGAHGKGMTSLNTVHDIAAALTPSLGKITGNILFAMGMLGAAFVAAIVVSLTAAWGLSEVLGFKRSLSDHPKEAKGFYTIYIVGLIISGIIVNSSINLVKISVAVEVMNAILLPLVLLFLFLLARRLPEKYRLKGTYAWVVGILFAVTAIFGFVSAFVGM
jgi:NRAMP (natural resistance-associated macrophage protein)-like metal ion transporter